MGEERFFLEGICDWKVLVPPTVYPPREDTQLLCRAISELSRHGGKAVEIGCGSGIVSIFLASLGWDVTSFDVNPYAVSATRGNLERHAFPSDRVEESGVGDGLQIPDDTELVVWNIPYLDRMNENGGLAEQMEEVALSDIPDGGWGGPLLDLLSKNPKSISPRIVVLLVLRTDPVSSSKISEWRARGWSCRALKSDRMGNEKIEVFGMWRTGFGEEATKIETCNSTMDEAMKLGDGGWKRVFSSMQSGGRGRRGAKWFSKEGGVFATWNLDSRLLENIPAGILQTSIGSLVSTELGAMMKWPNDIIAPDGRKMGGVLVESSEGDSIRVGVGLNRYGFDEEGISGSGWEETLGKVEAKEVFKKIDWSISSLFEDNGTLPSTSLESLISISWNALSGLLSEGTAVLVDGEVMRPVGLNDMGEIEAMGSNGQEVVRDLDGPEWLLES